MGCMKMFWISDDLYDLFYKEKKRFDRDIIINNRDLSRKHQEFTAE
jgi:hypothetical protein